jgi:hypothetical protein
MKTKMTLAQSKKALISVLFLLMLVGCQKSSDPLPEVTEHINPIDEITIEEAQSWILQNDSKYSIIWNKAQHNILSPKTPPIITVPITESPKGLIKYDNVSYEPSSIYQRLLFVKINGKIEVQLMQVLPKKGIKFDNYNFQFDDFSGVILLNSISKNEITNLWIYKNGVFLKNELVNSLAK